MLERIQKANDIKDLKPEELPELAQEIRKFLVEKISKTGGHLASNLGVVELTMAMHLVFDLPKDKIIWDVGHQSYTHKILTGRKDGFDDLRKYGGMSGFPKRKESACDAFDTGHSSTSISAGLGYVCARDLQREDYSVISVIGDGSLTGGMAYEALNNASTLKKNFIIVLNDNHMSISENVGGMSDFESDHPLAGVEFQRKLEEAAYLEGNGKVPVQLFGDFCKNRPSVQLGTVTPHIKGMYQLANVRNIFPEFIAESLTEGIQIFDHKLPGYARCDAVISGVESRTSSPVRLIRDRSLQSEIRGIYPCGEGAGYAGGITSAAMDGIKAAEMIASVYHPFKMES